MSFAADVEKFKAKTIAKMGTIRDGIDSETFRSIVEGSEITGAPGQPIGSSGKLHDSWQQATSETETVTSSDSPAALPVEENWSNGVFKNHGPHSVLQTVTGFHRIVETVASGVAND